MGLKRCAKFLPIEFINDTISIPKIYGKKLKGFFKEKDISFKDDEKNIFFHKESLSTHIIGMVKSQRDDILQEKIKKYYL